jgi:hypothetical protein
MCDIPLLARDWMNTKEIVVERCGSFKKRNMMEKGDKF